MNILDKLNLKLNDYYSYNNFLINNFNPYDFFTFKLKYMDKFTTEKIDKEYWIYFYPELKNQSLSVYKKYRSNNKYNIRNSLIKIINDLDNALIDLDIFQSLFNKKLEDKVLYQIFLIMYNDYLKINPDFKLKIPVNDINFYYQYKFKKNQFVLDPKFIKRIYNSDNPEDFFEKNYDKPILYSYKQLYNLDCKVENNIIYYQDKQFDFKDFCLNYLPSLTASHFFNKINVIKNNIIHKNIMFLLFIGNYKLGDEILLKIYEKYGKDIHLGIVTKDDLFYEKSEYLKRFNSVTLTICGEFGNDITPTLILYNYISQRNKFPSIFKIHTKSDNILRRDLVNHILNTSISKMNNELRNHNVYNHKMYMKEMDKLNIKYYRKYLSSIKTNKFLAFSIFYTNYELMDKIIDFIIRNNFTVLFTFNMYDSNWNVKNTPYHFMERLFYMIK